MPETASITPARWLVLPFLLASLLSGAAALWWYGQHGFDLVMLFFAGFALLWIAAALETLFAHITLGEQELHYRARLKTRRIPRQSINKVRWEKGCAVSIHIDGQGWHNLPALAGQSSQSLASRIRAWART